MPTIESYGSGHYVSGGRSKNINYFVKFDRHNNGEVNLGKLKLHPHMAGKWVRFKMEIIDD
jgi:hypothetical protein